MNVFEADGYFRVSRITGPKHNLLSVRLTHAPVEDGSEEVIVETLDTDAKTSLLACDVLAAVEAGLERVNAALGTSYRLRRVQFLESDTPPASIYSEMIEYLVETLHREHRIESR